MGLPTHRIEIRKTYQGHAWANDYLVEAASMNDAETCANNFINFERLLHYTVVQFVSARVSTTAIGDRIFRHIILNLAGLSDSGGAQFLPLFNVIRLDMETVDSDPCRKYYRIPVPEAQQDNGVLSSAILNPIGPAFAAMLADLPETANIVSNKGHPVVNGAPYPLVQMRQLHRHRRPKILP